MKKPTRCHLLYLLLRYMFRAVICPSSGVCDCVAVELPHWLYCSATISDTQHQRTLAAHHITYPIMYHTTRKKTVRATRKTSQWLKSTDTHCLPQQNISHLTHTTKHQNLR